jgi:cytochrome c-type biogenesis protein CcmH/NrfG
VRAYDFNICNIRRCSFRRAARRAQQKPKPSAKQSLRPIASSIWQFRRAKAYADIAAQDPKDFHAALQLGHIALLSNKLDDAEPLLRKALDLKHGDADAKIMLAEALYRKNDFFHAARALQGLEPRRCREAEKLFDA